MKIKTGTLLAIMICVMTVAVAVTGWWGSYLATPGPLRQEAVVVVERGNGPRTIATKLKQAGVIENESVFVWAVRVLGMDNTLQAGEYAFEPSISLRAVVNKLAMGETQNRKVTIPEGWTVKQAVERLDATEGLTGKTKLVAEGMLFPDTYAFRFGTDKAKLMESMENRMLQELDQAWRNRDVTLPLKTPEELLILASIVQKEAANNEEMPKIAAVFVNRLNRGMRLQSDPTVIYGAEMFDGNIRRKDLRDENPFNTYTNDGLPPTPIANPGIAALSAAARPALTDDWFFVSLPDRSGHVFSKTYREHQKSVKVYWREVERAAQTTKTIETAVAKEDAKKKAAQ